MNRFCRMFIVCLCISLVCAFGDEDAYPSGESAVMNGEFAEKDDAITGWECRPGDLGTFKITPAQEGSPHQVLTIDVRQANPKPWTMELNQRVQKTVEKGCTMYITFEYKMSKGYSFQFYWQLETPPWHKLLSMRITSPENQWHRVRVAAPVHETYQPNQTAFSFHLAEAPGILQLRDMKAIMVPGPVPPEMLDPNEIAVLGGDFYDREWREKVTGRLKEVRQVPVTVYVHRTRGKAMRQKNPPVVPKAVVILHQTSRPFKVGVSASSALILPELLARPEFLELKDHLGGYVNQLPEYRQQIFNSGIFSGLFCNDAFMWKNYESWGSDVVKKLSETASSAGLTLNGGVLYSPNFTDMPVRLRNMDRKSVGEAVLGHIEKVVGDNDGLTGGWSVVGEAVVNAEVTSYIGVDYLPKAFERARKAGKAKLYLSDGQALTSFAETPLQDVVELVKWLKDTCKVNVDGLVLDASMKRLDVGPQSLEKRLDYLAEKLDGMPLHITNLGVNMGKDDLQGAMVSDYMLLFFSHPSVSSVSLGELWTAAADVPAMGYLNTDFTARRSWDMIHKLLKEDWMSHEELTTDNTGRVKCRLFGGEYDITVAGGNTTRTFHLSIPQGFEQRKLWQNELVGPDYRISWLPQEGIILRLFLPMED